MRHIKASEFKAKCLKLLDDVRDTGEGLVVTKNGTPVAEVVAIKSKKVLTFGSGAGSFEIVGDIVSPMPDLWKLPPKSKRKRK